MKLFQPSFLLHGADYNYEQWLDYPNVLAEDFRLMREAHCNVMAVGIFSWVMLEPAEGQYQFEWLDQLMDSLAENGLYAMLATPSGAKPAWMSQAYPEIRLVDGNGRREPHHFRHNHCPTSPVYRQKTQQINTLLAERYKDHPALLLWHLSNEYGARNCQCNLCYAAFQQWLQVRYGSLDALNEAWWTSFWSHRFTDWSQIEPVDKSIHGLMLDWKRFVSDQVIDFYLSEIEPLRRITPDVPVTTNFMSPDRGLDYWKFAQHLDVVSWNSYPRWHSEVEDTDVSIRAAFFHDIQRSFKRQPFLLMESTPSVTNWQGISRPKRPGMHLLSSLQAVAHGANGVQYFQWRQSRGGEEKFHSAVLSHLDPGTDRIFGEVTAVGRHLAQLCELTNSCNQAEVGLLYDIQNEWAINLAQLPRNEEKDYQDTCLAHYRAFWEQGITVDFCDSTTADLSPYKLLIVPMLYMLRAGVVERLEQFVRQGGTLVATYLSGLVNESDLVFIGESPLRPLLGLSVEETDVLLPHTPQILEPLPGNCLDLTGPYSVHHYADIVQIHEARALAAYGCDFYAGRPSLTINEYGNGRAFYIAARSAQSFLNDFYGTLSQQMHLTRAVPDAPSAFLPVGVSAQVRHNGRQHYLFLMNFRPFPQEIDLGQNDYQDALSDECVNGRLNLEGYGLRVLCQNGQ